MNEFEMLKVVPCHFNGAFARAQYLINRSSCLGKLSTILLSKILRHVMPPVRLSLHRK